MIGVGPLGVLTAMPEEARALLDAIDPGAERIEHGGRTFTTGTLWGDPS
jgi:nucleoside phosphorylase